MTKREGWILRGMLALGAGLTALTLIFPQIGMLEWFSMIPMAMALYRLTDRKFPCGALTATASSQYLCSILSYTIGLYTSIRSILSGWGTLPRSQLSLQAGWG